MHAEEAQPHAEGARVADEEARAEDEGARMAIPDGVGDADHSHDRVSDPLGAGTNQV
ncbi:MAG: hypothetical protein JWR20_583 [Marmoricola sp.]|nr:hypothetical protein [Marmoricola sp.]